MTRLARGFTSIEVMGALAALLIILLAVVVWLRPTPQPIPPREQASIDSLAATQPHYDTVYRERVRVETLSVVRSAQDARQATNTLRVADSLHRVADEAQQAAQTAGERSERWYQVAEVRRVENDSLRSTITLLDTALSQQMTARIAASERATAAEQRLAATANLADRLTNDLKHGDCRVLYLLNCPSRRVSAVGGAVVAIAAEELWRRRK